MALDLLQERGVPLEKQLLPWRDLVGSPISKLDSDAFTRVRIILMNGIETDALRFKHVCARFSDDLLLPLARIRRAEQAQQTVVNWLLPPDQSPLETTIAYEQVAIEVTASIAQNEPDPYLAQVYRFGLLEDFDHLYRYSALLDRVEGKDANNILQSYTDILPGRPTKEEHRAPEDDLRRAYDRRTAHPLSKLNALTLIAGEFQTHDYYMNIGPLFADPVARQLYAEIAAIEEQHVTQYTSITDAHETPLEKLLLHEATEVYNYWCCAEQEGDRRVKAIWEQFCEWELGHLQEVARLFKEVERRDPSEILPQTLPDPIRYESQRQFVRGVLEAEVDLRANGPDFVPARDENRASIERRRHLNSKGCPSEIVARGYRWAPGTELTENGGYQTGSQEVVA
jgi:rubrerythrin